MAGSWEGRGGELLAGQSRASQWPQGPCLSGIGLFTALPPKTDAFIPSEQRKQLSRFIRGYGCGDSETVERPT